MMKALVGTKVVSNIRRAFSSEPLTDCTTSTRFCVLRSLSFEGPKPTKNDLVPGPRRRWTQETNTLFLLYRIDS
ncbi:hypothetical protein RB195_020108 [Necator americanus]|uniref:Uncharacterized protein n=1 Tax=Necator americanus TaxID=51031 RepID=A0ABR1CHV0_NECAM